MQSKSGFTIVELIIAIIVIAILAAITVVAFNSIRVRALESTIASDTRTNAWRLQRYRIENDGWATAWTQLVGPTWGTANKDHGLTVSNRSHYSELAVCYYFQDPLQAGFAGASNSDGVAIVGKLTTSGKVYAATTQNQVTRDITADYLATGGTSICNGFAQAYAAKIGIVWNMHPYVRLNNT